MLRNAFEVYVALALIGLGLWLASQAPEPPTPAPEWWETEWCMDPYRTR